MRRPDSAFALVVAVLLAGCVTSSIEQAPARPDRPWKPETGPRGEILAGKPAQEAMDGGYVLPSNSTLTVLPPPENVDPERVYSLPDLIALAESNNPETRIAWNMARHAALAAGVVESAYYPRIIANIVGGHSELQLPTTTTTTTQGVVTVSGTTSSTGVIGALSIQWLIFDFGERGAFADAARELAVATNIGFTAAHQKVIQDVARAYYAYSAAKLRSEIAAESQKNAQEIEKAAEERYGRGIGTVVELAQARQGTAQSRLSVVQSGGAGNVASLDLLRAIGVSPVAKIKIADLPKKNLSAELNARVDRIVSDAFARRPDVLAAFAAREAALAHVRAAEAEAYRPKLFLTATGFGHSGLFNVTAVPSIGQQDIPTPTLNIAPGNWGGSVLVGLAMPLYDGGARQALLQQARVDAEKASAELDRVRQDAALQVVTAQNALETALSSYQAASALEAAAQTTYDAILAAFQRGVGSLTDATVAQTRLLQARQAVADAYSEALSNAVTLAFATGALGAAPAP